MNRINLIIVFLALIPVTAFAQKKEPVEFSRFHQEWKVVDTIYYNPMAQQEDVEDFVLEGTGDITFPEGRLRIHNTLSPELKQKANLVYWCPETFPDSVSISYNFYPVTEPGLCIIFFSATGRNGEDLFDLSLNRRSGEYYQYHHGDIHAFHLSYFRRRKANTKALELCNLRKSYGHHMVAQGADPIPGIEDAVPPYEIRVVKYGRLVEFYIDDVFIFEWTDDGNYGPLLGPGKAGFRQMAPLTAEYSDLTVTRIAPKQ